MSLPCILVGEISLTVYNVCNLWLSKLSILYSLKHFRSVSCDYAGAISCIYHFYQCLPPVTRHVRCFVFITIFNVCSLWLIRWEHFYLSHYSMSLPCDWVGVIYCISYNIPCLFLKTKHVRYIASFKLLHVCLMWLYRWYNSYISYYSQSAPWD